MTTFLLWLSRFAEAFRFIKKFRAYLEAREAARRAERREAQEHVLDLVDTMLSRVEKISELHRDQGVAQAKASEKLAGAIAVWLEMFKQANEGTDHLTTATVRSEDEFSAERDRERERLIKKGYPLNQPRNIQLQWLLENDELGPTDLN